MPTALWGRKYLGRRLPGSGWRAERHLRLGLRGRRRRVEARRTKHPVGEPLLFSNMGSPGVGCPAGGNLDAMDTLSGQGGGLGGFDGGGWSFSVRFSSGWWVSGPDIPAPGCRLTTQAAWDGGNRTDSTAALNPQRPEYLGLELGNVLLGDDSIAEGVSHRGNDGVNLSFGKSGGLEGSGRLSMCREGTAVIHLS